MTDITSTGRTAEEVEESVTNRINAAVLHRMGTPEEIANLALFLASDESSFISGQPISCIGGKMDKM